MVSTSIIFEPGDRRSDWCRWFGSVCTVYVHLHELDASMMQSIIDNEPMGRYLNAYMAAFIVALEGFFSGLLVTFVLINYLTTDEAGQS